MKSLYRSFIYTFFRWFFKTSIGLFFRIDNPEIHKEARTDMASIVVSNHPNTMIDVLLSGFKYGGKLNFLANTGLFQTALSKAFFLIHFCIPIKRSNDPTLKGFTLQKSFALSTQALNEKKAIYIAVEGTSQAGYTLRTIKYGVEKIIIDFLKQSDQPIQLICNAVVYRAPARFRSPVHLKTVSVTQYQGEVGLGEISKKLEEDIAKELVHFPELTMEEVELFFSLLYPLIDDNARWLEKFTDLSEAISGNKKRVKQAEELLQLSKENKIQPGATVSAKYAKQWAIQLFLGSPIFALTFVLGFIPRLLSRMLLQAIAPDPVYDATIKVITSPFLYLIFSFIVATLLPWTIWLFIPLLFILALSEIFRRNYSWLWSRYRAQKSYVRKEEKIKNQFKKEVQDIKAMIL